MEEYLGLEQHSGLIKSYSEEAEHFLNPLKYTAHQDLRLRSTQSGPEFRQINPAIIAETVEKKESGSLTW